MTACSHGRYRQGTRILFPVVAIVFLCHAWAGAAARPAGEHRVADKLNLVPTPRHTELTEKKWTLEGWDIVRPTDSPLVPAAVKEVNGRIEEMGGTPLDAAEAPSDGAAIFIGRWCDPHIRDVSMALDARLGPEDPGEQGYVIAFGKYGDERAILLGGSDAVGTLYACVTFRRLLTRQGGDIVAREASVRDWPDFKIRCNGTLDFYRLRGTRFSGDNMAPLRRAVREMKDQVDFYLRQKVNVLRARGMFLQTREDDRYRHLNRSIMEILRYADSRGIDLRVLGGVDLADYLGAERKKQAVERREGSAYMWAAFDAHRRKARDYARLMDDGRADHFSLHPLDSGFLTDPELWSRRSEATRRMYGDDRARADLEQFMLYFQHIRGRYPGTGGEAVVFPYHYQAARPDFAEKYAELNRGMPNKGKYGFIEDREQAAAVQERAVDYWRRMADGLPDEVAIVFREAAGKTFDSVADIYAGHPITIWIYPGRNKGWLGTFCPQVRMAKTFWRPGRRDRYFMPLDMTRTVDGRPNRLAASEYLWHVDRPDASGGFRLFSRFYKHGGRVTEHQKTHLIPRIARILYGDAAEAFEPLIAANLSLNYVCNTRAATHGHDSDWLDDPYRFMGEQAEKFARVHSAFRGLVQNLDDRELPRRVKAWAVFYYRYTGLAATKAQLESGLHEARELSEQDKAEEAAGRAEKLLSGLETMSRKVEKIRRRSDEAWSELDAGRFFCPPYKPARLKALDGLEPAEYRAKLEKLR